MKKFFSLALCIMMILLPFSSCETSERESIDGKITTAEELIAAMESGTGDYRLASDIDLCGIVWEPHDFSGRLSGVRGGIFNYTIRNFTLNAKKDDTEVGFVKNLTGRLNDINFENVTIQIEEGFTGSVGTVAGKSSKKLESITVKDCEVKSCLTVKGSEKPESISGETGDAEDVSLGLLVGEATEEIKDCKTYGTVELCAFGTSFVGGIVGNGRKLTTCESRADIRVTAGGETAVGGLGGTGLVFNDSAFGGKLNLTANEGATISASQFSGNGTPTLYGCYANGVEFNCSGKGIIKHGTFNCEDTKENRTLTFARDLSNLEERNLTKEQLEIRRTVVDYMEKMCTIPWRPVKDMEWQYRDDKGSYQKYLKGEWYFGLPYTHQNCSLEKFQYYLEDNGNLKDEVPATDFENYVGNDCADAIAWAVGQVASSATFHHTKMMLLRDGLLKVGDYDWDGTDDTVALCTQNGFEKMCEAYAKVQMADVLLSRKNDAGHARLVKEAAYVMRNEDGTINGDRSYILIDEQGYISGYQDSHSTCRVGYRLTFHEAFVNGYIPETVAEYENAESPAFSGTLLMNAARYSDLKNAKATANYKIKKIRLLAKDGEETVFDEIIFPHDDFGFEKIALNKYIRDDMIEKLNLHEKVTLMVSLTAPNGTEIEVFNKELTR